MASGKRTPLGQPGARRRKPPLIDLEATEMAAPASPPEPPAETNVQAGEAPQFEQAATQPPPPPQQAEEPPFATRAERPMRQESHGETAEPPRPSDPVPDPGPGPGSMAWLPPELPWPLTVAGAVGAGGGLLAFLLLWLVGAWPRAEDPASALAPRFAAIETQLREIAARPAPPPGIEPRAIDDLAARLVRLEAAVAAPRPPVTDPVALGRLNTAESALKSLADNVTALSRRSDELAATLRSTQDRIDALAATVTELQKVAQASAVGSDRAVRLAVAASALRSAVERGDPFADELAVAKPLTSDPAMLAPLEPFAASGVPSNLALARELSRLIQPMLQVGRATTAVRTGDGFLDRLQANAERLVRIRPIDQAPGDDASAVLARVEARTAQSDVGGAVTELGKLPAAERATVQPWIARVDARNKALDTAQRFAGSAVSALKSAP